MHLGGAVLEQAHARGAGVVEAFRVGEVLEADREADAALHAFAARRVPGAAGQADRRARQLLRLGLAQSRAAADDLGHRQRARDPLSRRQRAAGVERVQQAQLHGIDLERLRELVHLRLGGEAGLDGAEPAHRAARRIVREDARRLDQRVRNRIRAARERRRVRGHRGRARRVRAAVEQDLHAHADEPAVPRRAVLGANARRVPVHVTRERLLPVVDHLHGAARVQREQRRVDLDRQVLAAAERAADAGEVDPHLLLGQAEARRDLLAVDVQPLRGDVDVDAALGVRDGEPRLRSEERLILAAELVLAFDDDVALRVGVAVDDPHRAHDVRARVVQVVVERVRLAVRDAAAPTRWPAPDRRSGGSGS